MASHKEEPNTSSLFGDSTGDDPFSQLQQQHPVSEPVPKKDEIQDKQSAVTEEHQPKTVAGDASSLFGNSSSGNADLFFAPSNTTANITPQSTNPPVASNASAASFFDQPQQASDSFFDGLGQNPASNLTQSYSQESQQQSSNPATSLTQAYDPNTYGSYDNNQQQPQELQAVEGGEQKYDQSQWIQFDPNQHYYYDDQGQVHYYDPNTNQEYDMSQYDYGQQGQTYDYQYDPQYADYYAQQGYDPNAYATTDAAAVDNTAVADSQQQQAYTPVQDNYDPNAYAPTAATHQPPQSATAIVPPTVAMTGQDYYNPSDYATPQPKEVQHQQNYQPQSYAPVTNAVAEVPAQVQSEQTIDTQHYTAEQQDLYGMQNYAPVDTSADANQLQSDYGYQSYDPNTITTTTTTADNTITDFQQPQYGQDAYAPIDFNNNNYSQIQADFEAEDLQQYQAPPPSRDVGPPPSGPPKNVLSPPPPPKQVISPPAQQSIPPPPKSTIISPPPQTNTPSAPISHRDSFDVNDVPEQSQQQQPQHEAPEEDLNDLDDLVLGGSNNQHQEQVSDKIDLLMETADNYDSSQKTTDNLEHFEKQSGDTIDDRSIVTSATEDQKVPENEIKTEPVVSANDLSPESKDKATTDSVLEPQAKEQKEEETPAVASATKIETYLPEQHSEESKQIPQSHVPEQTEQIISNVPDQSASYDFNYGYEPNNQPAENTYESDQVIGFESHPVTDYEPQQTSAYEPQQTSAYEPDQALNYESEQIASYEPTTSYDPHQQQTTSYEPQQITNYESQQSSGYESQQATSYEPQQSTSYEPQQATSYEPQQATSYEPQQATSYEPQQATSYEPYKSTSYESQPTNAYDPSSATAVATGSYESQQYGGYEPTTTTASNYSAPPVASQSMKSPPPPPRAGSIKSVASPPPPMQQNYPQRANSITEPDRRHHSASPFAGYYGNNNGNPIMERSATVPPPMTERMASPRPQLIPCPDRLCEGENKPKAKFCCECGRPLAGISRSTTPSAISPSTYSNGMEGFSPMSTTVFGAIAEPIQRTAMDDKKDAMIASLKQFVDNSVVIQSDLDDQEKRKRALAYIDARLESFDNNDQSKALLWRVVKSMVEHQESVLGDGGELDKSIIALISSSSKNGIDGTTEEHLDQLEALLIKGDREGACQFANEHDMWAHSLIIATSVKDDNNDLFKKTVTQFIQRELFSSTTELVPQVPGDKKALRMLYSVFNGAGADAVCEYVKTSTDSEAVYTDETLQGWQSALSLILANRSANDQTSIQGLGDQLKSINKDNEARLCYLLSPDVSGLDNNKLIGDDIYADLDVLYLVELYEFASKASIQQDFKLILAWWLTELGFTEESKKYIDSIADKIDSSALDNLKQVGDVSHITTNESENVTSLLNKENFDALIGLIEERVSSQASYSTNNYATTSYGYGGQDYNNNQTHDYTGQEAAGDSLQQDGYNYGYGYGGGYTESADTAVPTVSVPAAVTSPFGKPKGIQSPFQTNVQPVSSPFGIQNRSPAIASTAVTSPFGQSTINATENDNSNSNSAWWGGSDANQTEDQQTSYEPYQPETDKNASYQPDAYTPADAITAPAEAPKMASWDDDDDLGFGNSKPKKKLDDDTDIKTTDSTVQEKPNEVDGKKDKENTEKATGGGGWGLFSIFTRKEKEQNTDEKKAVKANLGEESSFYYDEKEKRWVNKLNDTKPAVAATPPPPKATTPKPPAASPMAPPLAGLKPSSMPPPPRINSAPNMPPMSTGGPTSGSVPNAAPPSFNTPPASRRAAGGARKPMRSRYVDVFNTDQK